MKAIGVATLSAVALALAGCGHKAADTASDTNVAGTTETTTNTAAGNEMADNGTGAAPVATGGQAFANAAAASDNFEITTSKLALTTSTSKSIKAFAQKMIDAHTGSTAKLKTAAGSASPAITPDPTLNADQQAKVDALKAANGKAFDNAYVADQTAGHQQTLDTLKGYAATGDVPALKTFASTLVPTVTAHLNMAKALKP